MPSGNRPAVLNVIRQAPGPHSATEIWDRLRQDGTRMGIATVYRALKSATDAGEIKGTEFPGGQTRYEVTGVDHHHHFLCTACDRAFNVSTCAESIQNCDLPGFRVTGHALMLFGTCGDCS